MPSAVHIYIYTYAMTRFFFLVEESKYERLFDPSNFESRESIFVPGPSGSRVGSGHEPQVH